jgi:hypothetical protein
MNLMQHIGQGCSSAVTRWRRREANVSGATAIALAAGCLLSLFGQTGRAQPLSGYRVSEPLRYENLAVYFIHGASNSVRAPLTLEEALTQGTVEVRETGTVQELTIDNFGDQEVFIQSGDIRPSRPSVRFTAFPVPTITRVPNAMNSEPSGNRGFFFQAALPHRCARVQVNSQVRITTSYCAGDRP